MALKVPSYWIRKILVP